MHNAAMNWGAIASIGVVGGGTAGYFAALSLKRSFPELRVAVIESPDIPVIGVGEATTTLMAPFLHAELGLDIVELWEAVKPTFKLGIRFEWGLPQPDYSFAFPFGEADPIRAAAIDGELTRQSLNALLMHERRGPVVRGPDAQELSLLGSLKFAYHLDNAPFVGFLAKSAAERGIEHVPMTIEEVRLSPDGQRVASLVGRDRQVSYDFYVDASGFRSRLMEQTLRSPFQSYASSLFCDRAIVATAPLQGGIGPYTTAETMNAGWCWNIPMRDENHRGYVHSSAFISEDEALAELRAKNPGLGEPWTVKFRSGRHAEFWKGNVAAVGNAYGFVEPLESTALHMVIIELAYLRAGLARAADPAALARFVEYANRSVGGHWDYLRWFLALHYKYNRRLETPFWQAARNDVDASGFDDLVRRVREDGPSMDLQAPHTPFDPAFGLSGVMTLLLGQHVSHGAKAPSAAQREAFEQTNAGHQKVLRWALPHAECLEILERNPRHLREFVSSPRSWCTGLKERIVVPGDAQQPAHLGG